MKQIWKYKLQPGMNLFNFRKGSEILSVQVQSNYPVLYAIVNTDEKELVPVDIDCRMTGQSYIETEHERFIGTVMLAEDTFVLHVFQVNLEKEEAECDMPQNHQEDASIVE